MRLKLLVPATFVTLLLVLGVASLRGSDGRIAAIVSGGLEAQTTCGNASIDAGETCDGVLAPTCPGECRADCTCPLNHFDCYSVLPDPFDRRTVTLADAFGTNSVTVMAPRRLCLPADKNGEDPTAAQDAQHLTAYRIRQRRYERRQDQTIVSQFGTVQVDIGKPELLLVPTAKNVATAPAPLTPAVDHYKCYRVTHGRTTVPSVTVADQFGSMTLRVRKPVRVCVAATKNTEPTFDLATSLACFQVKTTGAKPSVPSQVFIDNQFGPDTLRVRRPTELCVPAQLNPGGPTMTPATTATPTPTRTSTTDPSTPTPTATPTATATDEATATPTATATDEPSATPTATPTDEPTPTETPTPTDEPTPTETPTPTDEATPSETPTPTDEATPSETPTPDGPTPSPTATAILPNPCTIQVGGFIPPTLVPRGTVALPPPTDAVCGGDCENAGAVCVFLGGVGPNCGCVPSSQLCGSNIDSAMCGDGYCPSPFDFCADDGHECACVPNPGCSGGLE